METSPSAVSTCDVNAAVFSCDARRDPKCWQSQCVVWKRCEVLLAWTWQQHNHRETCFWSTQLSPAVRRQQHVLMSVQLQLSALIIIRLILFSLNVLIVPLKFIINSFPAKHGIFPRSHCYTLGGAITHLLNESRKCRSKTQERKTQKRSISYVSICIWKIMRSSTLTAHKWKLSNVTEWNVDPESVKGLWSFGILMEAIYSIFALIILLNMIQM